MKTQIMSLSILVLSSPFDSQASYSAYRFAKAALKQDIAIDRIFFYQSGIHNATGLACTPRDEFDLYTAWQELKQHHELDLVVCIAAAARRGLIDEAEQKRHQKSGFNMASEFELSGLGQLVEAIASSGKLITFGD
ncbi:MAG: sulfurtransferase complex subunit TusD [Oleiphilus sp.]